MRSRLVPVTEISRTLLESWVDKTRKPFVTSEGAYVPVRDGYPSTHLLPTRRRSGRGYQKLGDVVIVHGHFPSQEEILEISNREHPRGIYWISGHEGVIRNPQVTLLCGSGGEVTHRESGITYHLNVEQVMFSQGNREEKSRIAGLIRSGELVSDMFAGIGYFSLGMARAGAQVHAIEINPISFRYLCQNIEVNHLIGLVSAENGDCRDLLSGCYDRIHMGHFEAISFLPHALCHIHVGTVLHVHMLGDRSGDIAVEIKAAGLQAEITVKNVKKVGPRLWHMVADVVIV
ncbi:MAG: SAM-dependent methyltransferase [Methanospirillum sp.]|uniref:class I SAM-dependent methyltransferase n=1 Tax=Methanospirillum sp. TaxID=45200 RepID=UPI002372014E|nr:SAM-dependent methyltransferase [Methanospirillum sp.]MDD1729179.1 SAM-dependent methyltransferase [Methanospirillum sp.]